MISAHRPNDPSLFDLLPWDELVDNGILATVDGGLLGAFTFQGPDLDSSTDDQIEALTRVFERAIAQLGDGWAVYLEAQRHTAPPYPRSTHFPDPFTQAVDDERRSRYQESDYYRTAYYISLFHRDVQPARGVASRIQNTLLGQPPDATFYDRQLETFHRSLEDFAALLATQIDVRLLSSQELVTYLYRALTFRDHAVNLPDYPVSLEAVLGAGDLTAGLELAFDDIQIVPVSITGFPKTTEPAALSFLNETNFPFHAVWRFCPMDPYTARRAILSRRTKWASAAVSLRNILSKLIPDKNPTTDVKRFAERLTPAMAEDADQALLHLEKEQATLGYLTSTILIPHADRAVALQRAQEVLTECQNRGLGGWIETWNGPSAYLGALPGLVTYNQRRPLTFARTWVDLALTTSIWTGAARHPHPDLQDQPPHVIASTGSTPFYLSLCHHDVQHAIIVGPTGSGKSVLLNTLLAQYLRYPNAQIFAIDKGWSLYATTLAAGGHHYALSPDTSGGHRFAPLAYLESSRDRQVAAQWIEELVHLQGLEITPTRRSQIQHALDLLASTRNRTLAHLATKLQHRDLRTALEPYVGDGPHAHLFDGRANPLRDDRGTPTHTFEMEEVLPLRHEVVAPLLLYLFREIERRLDGRPTLILLEEAINYLGDTLWSQRLSQWLYELRKKNAGVVFVSQTLGSFLSSGLRDAVLEGCPTRIYLPNPSATETATAAHYHTFGLNERQIRLIADAMPRRDYYLDSPSGSRLFHLNLSPAALAVFGLAGPADRDRIRALVSAHPDQWLVRYLRPDHAGFADRLETTGESHAA